MRKGYGKFGQKNCTRISKGGILTNFEMKLGAYSMTQKQNATKCNGKRKFTKTKNKDRMSQSKTLPFSMVHH